MAASLQISVLFYTLFRTLLGNASAVFVTKLHIGDIPSSLFVSLRALLDIISRLGTAFIAAQLTFLNTASAHIFCWWPPWWQWKSQLPSRSINFFRCVISMWKSLWSSITVTSILTAASDTVWNALRSKTVSTSSSVLRYGYLNRFHFCCFWYSLMSVACWAWSGRIVTVSLSRAKGIHVATSANFDGLIASSDVIFILFLTFCVVPPAFGTILLASRLYTFVGIATKAS